MKFLSLLVYCFTIVGIGAAIASENNTPIVVFRIDDCQTTWRVPYQGLGNKSGLEYGKLKKIPITWAIIAGRAHDPSRSLTWSELQDYLAVAGGEAASHSVTHSALPTAEEYITELAESKAIIEANLPGYGCNSFIQPGYWVGEANLVHFSLLDNPIGLAIQANYDQSMGYLGDGYPLGANWRVGNVYYRYGMRVSCVAIDNGNGWTPELLCGSLDAVAATPGLVWVVYGHGVQETDGTAGGRITADLLAAFMDKLAELRDEGKVRLMGLHNAFSAEFSADLNRVPDGGFEKLDIPSSLKAGPWRLTGATIVQNGGIDDSRYVTMSSYGHSMRTSPLVLAPGRYELSWFQKLEPGHQTNKQLWTAAVNSGGPGGPRNVIDWLSCYNTVPDVWEQKKVLFLTEARIPCAYVSFSVAPDAAYGIDNVSIISAPLDPAVSPTSCEALPSPGQCKLAWDSPSDPAVTSIVVHRGIRSHPVTPTEGVAFAEIPASAGERQEVTAAIDWTQQRNCVYFSVFAVMGNGEYSPPELALVAVDKTGPTAPQINLSLEQPSTVNAEWKCTEPESSVVEYQYAVGTTAGGSDISGWISTQQTHAIISDLPVDKQLYFSVKAENTFGYWSEIGSRSFTFRRSIGDELNRPDGSSIEIRGIVTGVFDGYYYVEQEDRSRGLRIIANCECETGSEITVRGVLATIYGERALIPEIIGVSP